MSKLVAQQESPAQNVKWGDANTPEKTTYDDSSGAIFSMYINQAQKLDEDNVETWTGVADRILIFVRFLIAISPEICRLTCLTDRPLLIYGSYFHCHQLPEFAARSPHHHPVPPRTNIPTTF
jgi:hypothetical protein